MTATIYAPAMTLSLHEPTTDVDFERWLRIRNAVDPRSMTLVNLRAEMLAAVAERFVIGSVDDRDVAAGMVAWGPTGAETGVAFIDLWVLPGERGRGVGGTIVEHLVPFARERGQDRYWAYVRDGDEASLAFAQRRGLQVEGGGQLGQLDLTGVGLASAVATALDGVEIVAFADRPDALRDIYEVEMLGRPEIPTLTDEPLPTFETWQESTVREAGFLPDLSLIALDGDRVVGQIQVFDDGEQTAFIGMTAVHPEARRRGIARALKTELTRRAIAAGWRRIDTYNDGTNEGIRALNESLGYVYLPRFLLLKGPLPPAGGEIRS